MQNIQAVHWWAKNGVYNSNQHPLDYKSDVLPIELTGQTYKVTTKLINFLKKITISILEKL